MREEIVALDSAGSRSDVGSRAFGFRVVPARDIDSTARPGSYPIRVTLDSGQKFTITSDESKLLAEPFKWLQLSGGESGDVWKVQFFETPAESIVPPGQRGTVAVSLQGPTACNTAAPTNSAGFKVRPGTRAHTFYASGVAQLARLWVRSKAGNWYDTGDDLDFTSNLTQVRLVYASADRFQLRSAAATLLVEIDAEVEVG